MKSFRAGWKPPLLSVLVTAAVFRAVTAGESSGVRRCELYLLLHLEHSGDYRWYHFLTACNGVRHFSTWLHVSNIILWRLDVIMLILKMGNLRLSAWLNSYQKHTIIKWQKLERNWRLSGFTSREHIHCDFSHYHLTTSCNWILPFLFLFLGHIYYETFSPHGCKNDIKSI